MGAGKGSARQGGRKEQGFWAPRKEVPMFIPETREIEPDLKEAGGACPELLFLFERVCLLFGVL